MLKKLLAALGFALMLAVFYLVLLMGIGSDASLPQQAQSLPPSASAPAISSNLKDLSAQFGADVPYISLLGEGALNDITSHGVTGRLLTWQDDSGFTVSCIRPAALASCIRYDHLAVSGAAGWSIAGYPVLLAQDAGEACVYYSTDDAAYALYLPSGGVPALESLLSHLSFVVANNQ